MTPLRLQMIEEMKSAGLPAGTQAVYIGAVRRLAAHYHRPPDQLTEEDVRRYLLGSRSARSRPITAASNFSTAARSIAIGRCLKKKNSPAQAMAASGGSLGRPGPRSALLREEPSSQGLLRADACLRLAHQRSRDLGNRRHWRRQPATPHHRQGRPGAVHAVAAAGSCRSAKALEDPSQSALALPQSFRRSSGQPAGAAPHLPKGRSRGGRHAPGYAARPAPRLRDAAARERRRHKGRANPAWTRPYRHDRDLHQPHRTHPHLAQRRARQIDDRSPIRPIRHDRDRGRLSSLRRRLSIGPWRVGAAVASARYHRHSSVPHRGARRPSMALRPLQRRDLLLPFLQEPRLSQMSRPADRALARYAQGRDVAVPLFPRHRDRSRRAAVTFRYKQRKSNRWRACRVKGLEFMRRFLHHVLPKGLHKVRYFGLWHSAKREHAARARLMLLLDRPSSPRPVKMSEKASKPEGLDGARGRPCCHAGLLRFVRELSPKWAQAP